MKGAETKAKGGFEKLKQKGGFEKDGRPKIILGKNAFEQWRPLVQWTPDTGRNGNLSVVLVRVSSHAWKR